MPSTEVSAAENPARSSAFIHLLITSALLAFAGEAAAAPAVVSGKTYFFATREACVSSGAFGARECAAAFANARLQLRDRAPRFASATECRLKFRICEAVFDETQAGDAEPIVYAPDGAGVAYTPSALGVEMVAAARGAEAAPTLAIDSRARLFPYYPVSRPYERRREEAIGAVAQNPSILSADRFEPFAKRRLIGSVSTFTASTLGAIESAANDSDSPETPDQRRARLKAAPFIQ
jgi:uncharacterized protein YgiB involved in biofilm formation